MQGKYLNVVIVVVVAVVALIAISTLAFKDTNLIREYSSSDLAGEAIRTINDDAQNAKDAANIEWIKDSFGESEESPISREVTLAFKEAAEKSGEFS